MAIDAFMYFSDKSKAQTKEPIEIRGESSDEESAAKGSFEIISFEWGASAGKESTTPTTHTGAPGGAAGAGGAKPFGGGSQNQQHRVIAVENFKVAKPFDLASPSLFMACIDPKCVFEEAVVIFRKSGGAKPFVYLKFVFKQVRIDSVEWKLEAAEGTDKPDQEDVKCSFQEVEVFYSPQTHSGEKASTWGGSKKSAWYKRPAPGNTGA